jgi:transposase-like protein
MGHDRKSIGEAISDEPEVRAVNMVLDVERADPNDHGVIRRVARRLGVGDESRRAWVKGAKIDAGTRMLKEVRDDCSCKVSQSSFSLTPKSPRRTGRAHRRPVWKGPVLRWR